MTNTRPNSVFKLGLMASAAALSLGPAAFAQSAAGPQTGLRAPAPP